LPPNTLTNFQNRVLAISRDGTQIVYQTNQKLFLRSISDFDAKPIPGAEDTIATTTPTFSPDGRSIVYWSVAGGGIKTISTVGGTPVLIAPAVPFGLFGISWGPDGIVFAQGGKAERVPENGGGSTILADGVTFPKVLPGGKAILFSSTLNDRVQIAVQSLDSGKRTVLLEQSRELWPIVPDPYYVPTGHLLYGQGGTIFAVPFDLSQLKLTGAPVPVIPGVRRSTIGELELGFSDTGTLAYIPGPQTGAAQFDLALADRNGTVQPLKLPPKPYQTPRLSPDGKRVAFSIDDGAESNIWIYDLSRPNAPNRLTFSGRNRFPVWSSDGQWIAFQSDREGDLGIFRQRADGAGVAERFTRPEKGVSHAPKSWSPGQDVLLFEAAEGANFSLWTFSIADKKAAPFGEVKSSHGTNPVFSPDGKWIAYHLQDTATNNDEVFIQPFPATGARYQLPISRDNHHPVWSRDGKGLFYIPGPSEFAMIPVSTMPVFTFGSPAPFRQVLENYAPPIPRQFDVTPDGKLIGLIPAEQSQTAAASTNQINVVLNWFDELKQRVPVH
jgi:Tol biopolymer transport system component